MPWKIGTTDEFDAWFDTLSGAAQARVLHVVGVLREVGPRLGRPTVDTINGSQYSNMKELRVNNPLIRIFFAFDPRRVAMLLLGDDKTGDKRFYDAMIPRADTLYSQHLESLRNDDAEKF